MYKFDCGCEVPIIDDKIKECDGLPSMKIDYHNLNKECPATWSLYSSGRTKGVFQLETKLGQSWSRRLEPESIEELAALVAILRPGCLQAIVDGKSMTQRFIDRKHYREPIEYYHPALKDVLSTTLGVLIYQEQAIKISQQIAGFNLKEADELRKCLSGDSIMMTQSGPKTLEEISSNINNNQFNIKCLTLNKSGKLVYKKVNNVWCNGKKRLYKIRTNNGYSIKATSNHEIMTDRGWISINNLKLSDHIITPNKYTYKGYGNISYNKAIILSYFIGEGCYTDKCPPKITNSDVWILNTIKDCIENEFGVGCYKEYKHSNNVIDIYIKGPCKEWITSIYKKCYAKEKYIPKNILSSTQGITKAFIGAYFSGEGTVTISNRSISISSTSNSILSNLQMLLLRDGIHSTRSKEFELYINARKEISKFYNKYHNFICPRKIKKIEQILSLDYKEQYQPYVVPNSIISDLVKGENLSSIIGASNTSGSLYNNNLTYEKCYRLNRYLGSNVLQEILDSEYKFTGIRSIELDKEENVYDFEMDGNPHAAFINGVFVHNSIGKKDVHTMAEVEKKFISGCKKTNVVNEQEALDVFSWIKKSQRYAFNKAHSVGYGETGYWTAYTKAHFPIHFFCSWLHYSSEKADPFEEIYELISDAKILGINITPPSLNYIAQNRGDFSISNGQVNFGISSIKGVGQSHIVKMIKGVEEAEQRLNLDIKDWSWYELLTNIGHKVNKTAINNMIACGVLRHMGIDRRVMLDELERWRGLTEPEKKFVAQSRFSCLEEALTALSNSTRYINKDGSRKKRHSKIVSTLSTLQNPTRSREDTVRWIYEKESELLGVALTCHKVEMCDRSQVTATCMDFIKHAVDDCVLCVEVKSTREHKFEDKKTGAPRKMLFVDLEDQTCGLDAVAFEDVYLKNRRAFQKGNTLLVVGERSSKGSLNIKKVREI